MEEFVGLPVLGEVTRFVVREVESGLKTQNKAGPPQVGSWVHLEMALGQHSWECWNAFRGLLDRKGLPTSLDRMRDGLSGEWSTSGRRASCPCRLAAECQEVTLISAPTVKI